MTNSNYIRLASHLWNSIGDDHDFCYTCVKWWHLQGFFFVKLWVILSQLELSRTELPKCTPNCTTMKNCDHTICPVLSILFLYDPTKTACLFEKFIFDLEAFYSFKFSCILVKEVISLKKNGRVISKIYCLILWSPICTPLILVSASFKMAGTSATVTYNCMRVDPAGEILI